MMTTRKSSQDRLEMIQYTDPMCVWCYAMEPAVRKLQVVLNDQLDYRNICGLLVSDVRSIIGDDAYSDLRFAQLKTQMKDHFLDAARYSGVPVDPSWLDEARKEDVTSLPMTLAFEAIKLQDPERADEFLWECRANSHARKTIMSRRESVVHLAEQFVADKNKFLQDFDGKAAMQALESDLKICRAKGVHSFPTMELIWKGRSLMIQGYRDYASLKSIIEQFTDHGVTFHEEPFTMENVLAFVHRFEVVSGADLQTMYDLDDRQLDDLIRTLVDGGFVTEEKSAEGCFLHETNSMKCEGGICSL